jgi:hypothetical protein
MVAPIQSPAKSVGISVMRFLNAKDERPAEIHKQIVAVCGDVINRQNVTKWCCEFFEERADIHDEHRDSRPSLISRTSGFTFLERGKYEPSVARVPPSVIC